MYIPEQIFVLMYVLLALALIFFAITSDLLRLFSWMPYFCYMEIWVKDTFYTALPYSFSQFIMIAVFFTLVVNQLPVIKFHTRTFIFMFIFALVEIMNSVVADNMDYSRYLIYNTIYMSLVVLWSATNILSPQLLSRFIYNLKVAGVFLCGIIAVAHVKGDINYSLRSSYEATNGLAPNQVACYLGITAVLLFISIMENDDILVLILNTTLIMICTTLLALSFSRGGIYILTTIAVLYLAVNISQTRTIVYTFLMLPVIYIVYSYATSESGGLIEQRFDMQGTSGRDVLAEAAVILFKKNIFTGVGTGNFNTAIVSERLFTFQSGAHNEFTRVMAEHGLAGIIPYYGFYILLGVHILRRKQGLARQFGFYFFTLFFLITIYNALKIAVQPLLLVLAIASPYIDIGGQAETEPEEQSETA